MLRPSPGRRRPRQRSHICCAAAASFLLLLSISVLHSRLSSSSPSRFLARSNSLDAAFNPGVVLRDADDDLLEDSSEDRIDALDFVEEPGETVESDGQVSETLDSSGLFFDHVVGAIRRSFGVPLGRRFLVEDRSRIRNLFSSDDQVIDEEIRSKLASIQSPEDALLVKGSPGRRSPLREGWAPWFEAKGRYLRQDGMFRSSIEAMNPMNNALLQDPDGSSLTFLSRGDRLMQKLITKELLSTPFLQESRQGRSTLESSKKRGFLLGDPHIYPNGKNWGFYPGLENHSSFSEFVEKFLYGGQCSLRVFMVWNAPPWVYTTRFQRSFESLFHHHRDACALVFSETLELDFFEDFVKDGFKIAVAMPNLEELLQDMPVHMFASFWYKWRDTKHYTLHYSELVRLAALYKYGGIYLDSDVIILKPLSSLKNSLGKENEMDVYNGAVMAFDRNSPFIMKCLKEFRATYKKTSLRWNGAGLLRRVVNRLAEQTNKLQSNLDLNIEPSHKFFPISADNILRYFDAPVDEVEASEQSILLEKILNESITFHFWNSSTFSLVPQVGSLSEKLINRYCLRCNDVL